MPPSEWACKRRAPSDPGTLAAPACPESSRQPFCRLLQRVERGLGAGEQCLSEKPNELLQRLGSPTGGEHVSRPGWPGHLATQHRNHKRGTARPEARSLKLGDLRATGICPCRQVARALERVLLPGKGCNLAAMRASGAAWPTCGAKRPRPHGEVLVLKAAPVRRRTPVVASAHGCQRAFSCWAASCLPSLTARTQAHLPGLPQDACSALGCRACGR